MSAEKILRRLAKAYEPVTHGRTKSLIYFVAGDDRDVVKFGYTLDAAITKGKELIRQDNESDARREGELKLGWYRSETDGYCRDLELLAIRGDNRACVWGGGGLFTVHVDIIRKREYLGTELPKKGQWVDFDPAKVTCDQFPIKGKAGNDGMTEWIHGVEVFGYYADSTYPFRGRGRNYKFFQTWEAEE